VEKEKNKEEERERPWKLDEFGEESETESHITLE